VQTCTIRGVGTPAGWSCGGAGGGAGWVQAKRDEATMLAIKVRMLSFIEGSPWPRDCGSSSFLISPIPLRRTSPGVV